MPFSSSRLVDFVFIMTAATILTFIITYPLYAAAGDTLHLWMDEHVAGLYFLVLLALAVACGGAGVYGCLRRRHHDTETV